jgi:FkbM family methyltransferase
MSQTVIEKANKLRAMTRLYENWPAAVLDRFRCQSRRPATYKLHDGISFHVQSRTFDVRIINEIWIDKIYTPEPDFAIREGWNVVDVGAQKGIFAVFAASRAPSVKVYAFEPSPASFACLCHNIRLNNLENVMALNAAIASRNGEATLHLAEDSACNSLIGRTDVELRGKVAVETWPLSRVLEMVKGKVHLLKMDIEGMEFEVLSACPGEMLQTVERISMEYHERVLAECHCSLSDLARMLKNAGFSVELRPERCILRARRLSS